MLDCLCFFLANLISILGVNKGDLVKRGEKVLPTDIAFHRHTFGIVFVYSEFFSCKRRDVFEHFFFHKSAVHQKCRN